MDIFWNIILCQAISPVAKFHLVLGRGFMIQRLIMILIIPQEMTLNVSQEIKIKYFTWKYCFVCFVCLFVCLFVFVCGFSSHSRLFHSYGDVIYARHPWPLSSEGSYCDTGHPFIMVISEDPWQSHLLPSVWQCHYLFLRLRSVAARIRTSNLTLAEQTL